MMFAGRGRDLALGAQDDEFPVVATVGWWWNRQNNPEIDLVGADRSPLARQIGFLGSIKWHDTAGFDRHDYDALVRGVAAVPGGTGADLVAVSRTGVLPGLPLSRVWGPDDLIAAWR